MYRKLAAGIATMAIAGSSIQAQASQNEMTLLEEAASPYIQIRQDVDYSAENALGSAKKIGDSHKRLASYDHKKMGKAFLAYNALIAADQSKFAAAIANKVSSDRKRSKFLKALRDNPAMVRELKGAQDAIDAMLMASSKDANHFASLGEDFITKAYSLQNTSWARKKLPQSGSSRVTRASSFASSRDVSVEPIGEPEMTKSGTKKPNLASNENWSPNWSDARGRQPNQLDQGTQVFMTKALVLAARYSVDDLNSGHMTAFAKDSKTDRCFKMAKLNFDQCIAATRTSYEEAFCIGTHGLKEISRCIGWTSGSGSTKG